MPASNFDDPLTLNSDGTVLVTGELRGVAQPEHVRLMHIWLYQRRKQEAGQDGAAAEADGKDTQTCKLAPHPGSVGFNITMKAPTPVPFKNGPAIALAMAVVASGTTEDATQDVQQWSQALTLSLSVAAS